MDKTTEKQLNVKRTFKDSVFTDLFRQPEYLLQLYQTLHPEDTEITVADLKDISLRNILTDAMYNDLGFRVADRQIVMVECQSTWSVNILIRALQYLVETYNRYFDEHNAYLYGSAKAQVPKPELYVIYTGNNKKCPKYISFRDEFFGGEDTDIEVRIKVISGTDGDDIICQYITFSQVLDSQISLHGRTKETLEKAIDICNNKNVLKEYLESRRGEVMDIYTNLFDQEVVFNRYIQSERNEAEANGEAIGEARGINMGGDMRDKERITNMLSTGKTPEAIADFCGYPLSLVQSVQRSLSEQA